MSSISAARYAQGRALPANTSTAHYLRRVARLVLIRAAVRGRISWLACIRMLAVIDEGAA